MIICRIFFHKYTYITEVEDRIERHVDHLTWLLMHAEKFRDVSGILANVPLYGDITYTHTMHTLSHTLAHAAHQKLTPSGYTAV